MGRSYRFLRRLRLAIVFDPISHNSHQVPSTDLWNRDDLPILPHLVHFDLDTFGISDTRLLKFIFSSIPNFRRFILTLLTSDHISPNDIQFLNGRIWQELLSNHVSQLDTFALLIGINKRGPPVDLNAIVNSFQLFTTQYHGWDVTVDRWRYEPTNSNERVCLRTSNHPSTKRYVDPMMPPIVSGTFETQTTSRGNDNGALHSYCEQLHVLISMNTTINYSLLICPPFKHVNYLFIEFSRSTLTPFWNRIFKLGSIYRSDDNHLDQCISNLSRLVRLSNVTELVLQSVDDQSWIPVIEQVLLTCPKLVKLVIDTRLLLSPMLFDNPSLSLTFSRLQTLKSVTDDFHFSVKCASKLVQRFPSLVDIQLKVFSFDVCVSLVDILLGGLAKLSHLNMNYSRDTLLDNPFSCDYVIRKRRHTFPINRRDEENVSVQAGEQALDIWLS